jgi:ABC-type multidrug transport system fused ATPase/permease subunit
MDGLGAEDYDRTYGDGVLLRRIASYFRPAAGPMTLVATMIVLTSLMQSAIPVVTAWGLDRIVRDSSTSNIATLTIAILVAGVLGWVFNYVRQVYSARVVGDVVLTLREDAFGAVLERDLAFYDETPTGRVVSRVTSDTDDFANVVSLTMNLLSQILLVVVITALLFARDLGLALITLAITPVVMAMALLFRRIARDSTRRAQRSLARVNANVAETMGGIAVAKSFRQEATLYEEFVPINEQNYQVTVRQGFIFNAIFPLLFFVAGLGTVLLVAIGGHRVLSGGLSAGDWYLFLQSVALFWFPLTSIASFWSQFQQGLAASERVFALIDAEPQVRQTDSRPVGRLSGKIEFQDVVFGYTDKDRVLDEFTLTVAAGETVALVGHTGAGKSTLGKLITRFYEFAGGRILLDGQDIRSFDLSQYRRQLGVVPQTPFLFSGTVAENIRYPRPDASDNEVAAAASHVGGGDWLDSLPDGLQTEVGEYGKSLSMGQRQLVALARMLVQDPAIVILDEATASVDPLTEAQIQEGLDVVLADRTSVVIAHRLSTIEHADRIVVLRKGRIVEQGDHATLMRLGGEYGEVYNAYFRHQSPDYLAGTGFVPVRAALSASPTAD